MRQVLQHLSNTDIAAIIPKLSAYRWVLITEHYPTETARVVPNLDKVAGAHTRMYRNSAVYLTEPPFSIPSELFRMVLEVPSAPGTLRTYLYRPHMAEHPG